MKTRSLHGRRTESKKADRRGVDHAGGGRGGVLKHDLAERERTRPVAERRKQPQHPFGRRATMKKKGHHDEPKKKKKEKKRER